MPGGAEAVHSCNMLEHFGLSRISYPPPGVLEDVLQLAGVRAPNPDVGSFGETFFRSQGPLYNDDFSTQILDIRERAEVRRNESSTYHVLMYTNPCPLVPLSVPLRSLLVAAP